MIYPLQCVPYPSPQIFNEYWLRFSYTVLIVSLPTLEDDKSSIKLDNFNCPSTSTNLKAVEPEETKQH